MKDELISLYIDNELDLDEKIEFVETVHADPVFTQETLSLLKQEKLLSTPLSIDRPIPHVFSLKRLWSFRIPFNALAAALVTATIIMCILWPETKYQKVLHSSATSGPYVEKVEIASAFSGDRHLPIILSDRNRYWKYPVEISPGESGYGNFLEWKLSAADFNAQFRKTLKYSGSEIPNSSFN